MNKHLYLRAQLFVGSMLVMALVGCGSIAPLVEPAPVGSTGPETTRYLKRADAQAQIQEQVEVKVAVLRENESQSVFGLALAEKGIQPVWVEINNRSKFSYWFLPVFLDKDFFSAHGVAYLFHGGNDRQDGLIERLLSEKQVSLHVPAGGRVAGFVYTNVTLGIKLVNVELAGSRRLLRFAFARELPGGGFDFQTINPAQLYPPKSITEVSITKLGNELDRLVCCTTDQDGRVMGDPLNLAIVGEEHDVLVAMVRGGWDFTETTTAASVGKMIESMVAGALYRNSPISPLHFKGRKQDFAMQRAGNYLSTQPPALVADVDAR